MSTATPPTSSPGGAAHRMANGVTAINGGGGRALPPEGWANNSMNGRPSSLRKPYPHISDLVAEANTNLDIHAPMRTLLQLADQSARKAETDLGFGRLDLAYVEYLIATDLVANHVPKHKDYPELHRGQGEWWRLHTDLQKRLNVRHPVFKNVGDRIREDNLRSGVRSRWTDTSESQPTSTARAPLTSTPYDNVAAVSMPDGPIRDHPVTSPAKSGMRPQTPQSGDSPPRRKPVVQPKPQSMQGRPYGSKSPGRGTSNQPPADALADRFARLRSPVQEKPLSDVPERPRYAQPEPTGTTSDHGSRPIPRPENVRSSGNSENQSAPNVLPPAGRPSGPRGIPPSLNAPSRPPKLPLNTSIVNSLPKQPSPTYSPARHPSSVGSMDFPNAQAAAGGPNAPAGPAHRASISSQASNLHRSQPSYGFVDSRRPPDLPNQTTITADELFKYLRQGSEKLSVLIIDVRSRRDFDEGHIFAQNIMCIEPLALRPGMSAEDIEERLVLSPETEQSHFSKRARFDLVVFHDMSATSVKAAGYSRPSLDKLALSSLEQALGSFSYGKPLQHAPVLLVGGLEAWIDLVGIQALKATLSPEAGAKLGRPLGRVPKARSNQKLELRKRTQSDEPEAPVDDSQIFELPADQVQRSIPDSTPAEQLPTANGDEDRALSYSRDYEEFLHKFPEISDMKESMMSSPITPRGRSGSILDDKFHGFSRVHQSPTSDGPRSPGPISRPAIAVPRPSYRGQSEKSYYPAVPERPPPIVPPIPVQQGSFPAHTGIRVGQTGLANFGATCYMNSVVQCLSATTPLTRFFMDGSFRSAIQRNNALGTRGRLPEIFANTMRHLWDGNSTFIAPRSLREFVAHDNIEFQDDATQHDANDFFVYILDRLHEDMNYNFKRTPLKSLSTEDEKKRESMPPQVVSRIEFNRYSHMHLSWISRLFDGQHSSRLQCPACGCSSTSYETFKAVSLEIPRGASNIYQCLDNYTKQETLTGDDRWLCPDCKVPREATKKITFTRAPRVLVVQLKRFQTVRRGLTNKNSTKVRFPLMQLDMAPYMLPPLSPEARQAALAKYGDAVLEPETETTPPFRYDAYAVVQHMGSLSGGHYTALVCADMQRGAWMEFNDKHVQPISADRVATEKAYLVFYVRTDTPV
ncbi:MAG: ubiquitin-specific protease doa4 [Chaenotheca gracillima]|nr:MAG: ubiquitin-specific protease doa4 [Chaenotheca gracillima]